MDKKHKILVVDDDPKALILMEAVLESHGYDVILVNDGGQVIQTAKEKKPELILLDIMMPVFDGYTVLAKIKKDETIKNIPVVMVTALVHDGNKAVAGIFGASAYITKPVNSKHLIETIARFLPDSMS
jgi:CheY-like chemotaxis protein